MALIFPDEINSSIGKQVRRVSASFDMVATPPCHFIAVPRVIYFRSRGILASRVKIAGGNVPVVRHAAKEDLSSRAETPAVGSRTVMPLAGSKGSITCLLQGLAQQRMVFGNALSLSLDVVKSAAGMEHGPAGHAYRSTGAAHYVAIKKGRTARHKLIQVRSGNIRVVDRPDRIEALIIRKEENNVGFAHGIFLLGSKGG